VGSAGLESEGVVSAARESVGEAGNRMEGFWGIRVKKGRIGDGELGRV